MGGFLRTCLSMKLQDRTFVEAGQRQPLPQCLERRSALMLAGSLLAVLAGCSTTKDKPRPAAQGGSSVRPANALSLDAELRESLLADTTSPEDAFAQQRMREMHELIDRLMTWFDDVQKLAPETAMQLMGMGSAVTRLLDLKDKITGRGKSGSEA